MKKILFASALAAALVGCDQPKTSANEKSAAPETAQKTDEHKHGERLPSVPYSSLKAEDAVIVIDGQALTKGMIENECNIQVVLASIANRNLTVEQGKKIQENVRNRARKNFMLRCAVLNEAARRGMTVTDGEFTAFCTNFAKRITRKSKKMTFDQLQARFTDAEAQSLKDDLRRDCLFQKAHKAFKEECLVAVTKEEAERRFRLIERYNENARKKETEIYANATNAWKRLQKGESFETLVADFAGQAPEIDADMDWGTFQRGFFKEDPNVYAALEKMGPGEYTPPIEGNGGLIIFQLLEIQPPTAEAAAGGDFYHLAKIFYQLPIIYDLTDADALQKQLVKELSDEKLQRKLLDLQLACKVEHPNGAVNMRSANATLPMAGTMPTPVSK